MDQFFTLQDLSLRVTCSESIANVVVPILDYHGFQPAMAPDDTTDWTVTIEEVRLVAPLPSDAVSTGAHESGMSVYRSNDILFLYDEGARAEIAASGHRLDVELTHETAAQRDALNPLLYFIITFSLLALLQRQSLYAIHGAAVCRGENQGVLFVGHSDTGKSTMTMSLVRKGWHYLSDDSIFVRQSGDLVEALPFRRDFGLDPDSDRYFPELSGHESTQMTDVEKWRVKVDQLYPSLALERCVPRAILFPRIVEQPSSSLNPLSQAEALALLMRQCSFIDTDRELAASQMKTLQGLVRQCSVHKLEAGRDLKDDPGSVETLLLPLLGLEA